MTDSRMPSRRTAGSRRRPAPPPSFPTTPVVLVGGVLVVVVLLFVISSGSGEVQAGGGAAPAQPVASRPDPDPEPGNARAGKTPQTPAPAISAEAWAQADAQYDKAKELWTQAQLARNKGESKQYADTLRVAWTELEKLREVMSPYTDWFEQADLEGWAMPAEYDRLQQRLNQWDPLRQKVHKLMPTAR